MSEMVNQERSLLKSSQGGKVVVPLYSMVKDAVVYSNALSFFGPQLGTALILEPALDNTAYHEIAQDRVFLKAATDFIESTLLVAEIMRLLPEAIAP